MVDGEGLEEVEGMKDPVAEPRLACIERLIPAVIKELTSNSKNVQLVCHMEWKGICGEEDILGLSHQWLSLKRQHAFLEIAQF